MIQYVILLFYVYFGLATHFSYKYLMIGMDSVLILSNWIVLLLLNILALFKIWKLKGRKIMFLHLTFLIIIVVASISYTVYELKINNDTDYFIRRYYFNNESDTIR